MFSQQHYKIIIATGLLIAAAWDFLPTLIEKLPTLPSVVIPKVQTMTQNSSSISSSGTLFIEIDAWAEGMAAWTVTMSVMIAIAQRVGGKVVEPCIRNGRLGPCGTTGTFAFGQVFDVSFARPWLVSQEEFDKLSRSREMPKYSICMAKTKYEHTCNDAPPSYGLNESAPLENAVAATKTHPHGAVLHIVNLWKYGFKRMTLNGSRLVDYGGAVVTGIKSKLLRFKKEHRDQVTWMLREMGVRNKFNVIHWRAELHNIDYLECARYILRTADVMGSGNTTTVLLSSLNLQENLQWGGAKAMAQNTTASRALQLLLDSGMKKLDSVTSQLNVTDMIQTVVWDVILAMMADRFATCRPHCNSACQKCSHGGHFNKLLVSVRGEQMNKSSDDCWPS